MVRWHDDQRARRPTGSWTHCLYSSDIWLEVTIQDDVDHGNFEDQAEPQKTMWERHRGGRIRDQRFFFQKQTSRGGERLDEVLT